MNTQQTTKWQPEHFPNGTVFELNDNLWLRDQGKPCTHYTVTGIVRNGIRSYVLKTGVMQEHGLEEAYNLDHVKRIILRGTGQVLINQGWYGFSKENYNNDDVKFSSISQPYGCFVPRKGYYNTISVRSVLFWEVTKLAKPSMYLDWELLTCAVISNTWFKSILADGLMRISVVNKRRLRKFLKANLNRFLCPLAPAIKEYEKDMEREYSRDL
jgi:hypothetical protein